MLAISIEMHNNIGTALSIKLQFCLERVTMLRLAVYQKQQTGRLPRSSDVGTDESIIDSYNAELKGKDRVLIRGKNNGEGTNVQPC